MRNEDLPKVTEADAYETYPVGFTCSCFDLLHAGHIVMLEEAKRYCDRLVVGLQVDPTIDRPEKNKPVQTLEERRIQLYAVRYVDQVLEYSTEAELLALIKQLNPDIRFLGDEYRTKAFTGRELPIPIHFNHRDHGWSTTELRRRVASCEL